MFSVSLQLLKTTFWPRWGTVGTILVLLLLTASIAQAGSQKPRFVTEQIVVRLNPDVDVTIETINAAYGTTTVDTLPSVNSYLLQMPADTAVTDLVDLLELDTRLEFAEPNYIAESPEANPSSVWVWGGQDAAPLNEQYALTAVNLLPAQAISQGEGIIVAVLDTGIQTDHPALAAAITPIQADFVTGDGLADDEFNGIDDDGDGLVDEAAGHGTHVAGIIHLVAPEAQIMPVRVLDSDGNGDVFALAQAILFASDNDADVINLSLGLSKSSGLLKEVIKQASRQGTLAVAAAGNLGNDDKQYPAAGTCALAVTAVGLNQTKASFANFGRWITIAAPGESIYSTFPQDGYAYWSGTSMATPFVSGQAALLSSLDASLTTRDLNALIVHSAQSLDLVNPEFDGDLGNGEIDLLASLQLWQTGNWQEKGKFLISSSCVEQN